MLHQDSIFYLCLGFLFVALTPFLFFLFSGRQSRNWELRGSWPVWADLFHSQLSLWNISGFSAEMRFKTSPRSGVFSSKWNVYFLSNKEI